jgi:taurine--2-oxoglutarate transaminase
MGDIMADSMRTLTEHHACVGATRSIGLFGVIEPVKNRSTMEPLEPLNGSSSEMQVLAHELQRNGLYTFVRWNTLFTNPPLSITKEEMHQGSAIIDRALSVVDNMLA